VVPSKSKVVLEYDFKSNEHSNTAKDSSGNQYDGKAKNVEFEHSQAIFDGSSFIETALQSMGPPYTLSFGVTPKHAGGVLFSGSDSVLLADTLTWNATGQLYTLNYTLPLNKETQVEIHATREYTFAYINNDRTPRYWYTELDIWGDYMQQANMSFAAPLHIIGSGFHGALSNIRLVQGA
jgi:hexosaminidase